jgi:hypothetical protein
VVGELDVRRERRGIAIGVRGPEQRRERARRRRGTVARGAVGEELGIPLVQPGERSTQPVGRPLLGPPTSPVRIGFDQNDPFVLVGADVEVSAGDALR